MTGAAERAVAGLAWLAPAAPAPSDDLARAVRYLGLDVEPATVTAAAAGGVVPVGLT
ncbi:MAG: hypothetical protein A07HB70_00132, partial [uncultured archaeon A07HB70]